MPRIHVLGPVEVRPGPPLAPRVRRLLAVLMAHAGEVVAADRLALDLWGDALPANVDGALHTVVSRLRDALRPDGGASPAQLLTRAPGYVLEPADGGTDVGEAERLVAAAAQAPDAATAADLLGRALEEWRGPAYAEFADEAFARAEVARLGELRLAATEDRVHALLETDRTPEAVLLAGQVVEEAPLRERPHALLMLALARSGRTADALSVYRRLRDRLADELGLDPGPELQHLHAAILRGDAPAPRAPTLAPAGARRPAAPPLPPWPRELVGRGTDLDWLTAALAPGELVTLVGPGGVGKTSLALTAAHAAAPAFADGSAMVLLSSVPYPETVPHAVTTALGIPARHGVGTVRRLVDHLRNRTELVLIDNCEHVAEVVAPLVGAVHRLCPTVCVLATSRTPLGVAGERVRTVHPLALPAHGDPPTDALASDAVRLLRVRAEEAGRDPTRDERDADALVELCTELDGLPLAIELAASRLRTTAPADMVAALRRGADPTAGHGTARPVTASPAPAEARHSTLRDLLDWSYALLPGPLAHVLELVSVFNGPFTLDEARRLAASTARDGDAGGDVTTAVPQLVDHSLLVALPDGYLMLSTVRRYAREALGRRRDAWCAYRAHAVMVTDLAASTQQQLFGREQRACADRLAGRHAELRAAHRWACEHDLALAARLVAGLILYVEVRMPAEVTEWARQTVRACESDGESPPGLAGTYAVAAAGARFLGALRDASSLAERGLRCDPDPFTRSYLHYLLAEVAMFEGRTSAAWEQVRRLEALGRSGEHLPLHDLAGTASALLRAYEGAPVEAAEEARANRARALAEGQPAVAAWATYTIGECLLDVDPVEARVHLDDALARAHEQQDHYLVGVTLVSLATLRMRHEDAAAAWDDFVGIVEHWHTAGNWVHQWNTLRNVMDLWLRLERLEPAATLHGALNSRSTSAAPFGADAERMQHAEALLVGRLGTVRAFELRALGARMSDEDVVAFVLDVLRREVPAGTQGSSR